MQRRKVISLGLFAGEAGKTQPQLQISYSPSHTSEIDSRIMWGCHWTALCLCDLVNHAVGIKRRIQVSKRPNGATNVLSRAFFSFYYTIVFIETLSYILPLLLYKPIWIQNADGSCSFSRNLSTWNHAFQHLCIAPLMCNLIGQLEGSPTVEVFLGLLNQQQPHPQVCSGHAH